MSALLFGGDDYYPSGGWFDLIGEYKTVSAAKARVSRTHQAELHPERDYTFNRKEEHLTSTSLFYTQPREYVVGDRRGTGTVTAVDGDMVTVRYPAETHHSWAWQWAHIVEGGRIVAHFKEGEWIAE